MIHLAESWPYLNILVLTILVLVLLLSLRNRYRTLEGKLSAYRDIFNALPVPAYIYDADNFGILAVNQEAITLYGYSREDFLSLKASDMLSAGKLRPLLPGHSKQETMFLDSGRWQHRKKNGKLFYVQVHIRQLRFGKRQARLGVAFDIAQLIATENLLTQKSAEFLKVLESISDAFYSVDTAWRFTYVNKAYENLQHRCREELLGKNVWQLFPYGKERRYYREYRHALRRQVSVHFEEFNPHKGMWVSVDAYPSQSGLAVFFHDITLQRSTQSGCLI